MDAPSADELLTNPVVRAALEQAWQDSMPEDPILRCEEGGWFYVDVRTGEIAVRRAPSGGQAVLDLSSPPAVPGKAVVATFHTHPNPSAEGWDPRPSAEDTASAWLLGLPCIIRSDEGIYTTGPSAPRSGHATPDGSASHP